MSRPLPEHGTTARYHRGCRCGSCRAACAVVTKEYNSRPEVKQRQRAYRQTDAVKEKQREYRKRPEVMQRNRDRMAALRQDPAYRERHAAYCREYQNRPEVAERLRQYRRRPDVVARVKRRKREHPAVVFSACVKDAWVDLHGGCIVCGYAFSPAIHPHHIDPDEKAANTGRLRWRQRPVALASELAKCVCLCATHHAVLHGAVSHWRDLRTADDIAVAVLAAESGVDE